MPIIVIEAIIRAMEAVSVLLAHMVWEKYENMRIGKESDFYAGKNI